MKRSEVRQVTIVTEFCTEVPFKMPCQFPLELKGRHSGGNTAERGSVPKAFYAKEGGLQSKLEARYRVQPPVRCDLTYRDWHGRRFHGRLTVTVSRRPRTGLNRDIECPHPKKVLKDSA